MKIFKIVAVNLVILSTLIVSLEIFCQLAYLAKNGKVLFLGKNTIHNRVFEVHPFLAGRPKANIREEDDGKFITIIDDHTRWTGADQNDANLIRIAVLGGSTAFGTNVTDEDSWPALLQAELGKRYAVINYGVPGYSTAENIIQMALIVPEKKPHVVIYYEGWNDIRNYHEKNLGPDYYGHGMMQFDNLGISIIEKNKKFQSIKNVYATAWWAEKIKKMIQYKYKKKPKPLETSDEFVDNLYVRNLNTLRNLSKHINAFTVFVPQVLNYEKYYGGKYSHSWTRNIKDSAMPQLMDRFNSHMNEICVKEDGCAVLDEVLKEKWLSDDFVDDGHFSRTGGLKFIKFIAKTIRTRLDDGISEYSSVQLLPVMSSQ